MHAFCLHCGPNSTLPREHWRRMLEAMAKFDKYTLHRCFGRLQNLRRTGPLQTYSGAQYASCRRCKVNIELRGRVLSILHPFLRMADGHNNAFNRFTGSMESRGIGLLVRQSWRGVTNRIGDVRGPSNAMRPVEVEGSYGSSPVAAAQRLFASPLCFHPCLAPRKRHGFRDRIVVGRDGETFGP